MKKTVFYLGALIVIFGICGCVSNGTNLKQKFHVACSYNYAINKNYLQLHFYTDNIRYSKKDFNCKVSINGALQYIGDGQFGNREKHYIKLTYPFIKLKWSVEEDNLKVPLFCVDIICETRESYLAKHKEVINTLNQYSKELGFVDANNLIESVKNIYDFQEEFYRDWDILTYAKILDVLYMNEKETFLVDASVKNKQAKENEGICYVMFDKKPPLEEHRDFYYGDYVCLNTSDAKIYMKQVGIETYLQTNYVKVAPVYIAEILPSSILSAKKFADKAYELGLIDYDIILIFGVDISKYY